MDVRYRLFFVCFFLCFRTIPILHVMCCVSFICAVPTIRICQIHIIILERCCTNNNLKNVSPEHQHAFTAVIENDAAAAVAVAAYGWKKQTLLYEIYANAKYQIWMCKCPYMIAKNCVCVILTIFIIQSLSAHFFSLRRYLALSDNVLPPIVVWALNIEYYHIVYFSITITLCRYFSYAICTNVTNTH